MATGRPEVKAYLDESTADDLRAYCNLCGVSASALIESFARSVTVGTVREGKAPGWAAGVVRAARRIDAERRARS
jgi:hypothetical protein